MEVEVTDSMNVVIDNKYNNDRGNNTHCNSNYNATGDVPDGELFAESINRITSPYIKGNQCEYEIDSHNMNTGAETQQYYHIGYFEYLQICFDNKFGAIITPDIILFLTTLQMLPIMINKKFNEHFINNMGNQCLVIDNKKNKRHIDFQQLEKVFSNGISTEMETIIPYFSTTTNNSRNAMLMAFSRTIPPYYNEFDDKEIDHEFDDKENETSKGISRYLVCGNVDDWIKLKNHYEYLSDKYSRHNIVLKEYLKNVMLIVSEILNQVETGIPNIGFWSHMYYVIGNEVCGWLIRLLIRPMGEKYYVFPSHKFSNQLRDMMSESEVSNGIPVDEFDPENISEIIYRYRSELLNDCSIHNTIGLITYANNEQEDLVAKYGIFSSQINGEYLCPEFNYIISVRALARALAETSVRTSAGITSDNCYNELKK